MRIALALVLLLSASVAAMAETGAVIVIPGRPGVPVIINGRDASYAMVEGDWGLERSIHVQPTVYGGWDRYEGKEVGHYYPNLGRKPGSGRLEIVSPADKAPKPAESFHQSWSGQSTPPASALQPLPNLNLAVPYYPPAVIPAPRPR
ncbi:MAG: hypothetical protein K2W78_16425 [Xanthobacteraceae bacterium]|nr:hypothetical protein [Xanthobacteraceae bacterium]